MNHKHHHSLCRRMGMTRDPLLGAYGTYPTTPPRQQRSRSLEGETCSQVRGGQGNCHDGCGCHTTFSTNNSDMVARHNDNSCGCGCVNVETHGGGCGECHKLLQQIRAVDFALYEVILYLDVYPESCEALDTYHKLVARRQGLYQQYQSQCGPLTATANQSRTSWDWIDQPFPWENAAN